MVFAISLKTYASIKSGLTGTQQPKIFEPFAFSIAIFKRRKQNKINGSL